MPAANKIRARLTLLAAVALLWLAAWWLLPQFLSLQMLAAHDDTVRTWCRQHTAVALGILFAGYTTVTAASIPAAALMTMAAGWLFGFWSAFVVISFASTLGATCAFLISRSLLRDAMLARYGHQQQKLLLSVERNGAAVVLLLRLVPTIPFFWSISCSHCHQSDSAPSGGPASLECCPARLSSWPPEPVCPHSKPSNHREQPVS